MSIPDDGSVPPGAAPLLVHVVHSFEMGGLQNGLLNLLDRLPAQRYRHAVVSLTGLSGFERRLCRDDVRFYALHKAPGRAILRIE